MKSILILLGFALPLACAYPDGTGDDEIGGSTTSTDTTSTDTASACQVDTDCMNPAEPICDQGVCVMCVNDNQCAEPYPDCISGWCAKPCPMTGDALEPNDSALSATVLANSEDYVDLWLCPNDEDWFEITLASPHFVSIVTNADAMDGNLDIALLDANSNLVASSKAKWYGSGVPRSVEAIHIKLAPISGPATYRLFVSMPAGVGQLPYRLTFHAYPAG